MENLNSVDIVEAKEPKKSYCARCFLPIDREDKVDIEGQNFHRNCCTCCVCRTIPASLKMFYGHVFCNECFKAYVMNKFKGQAPRMCNGWWQQWGPAVRPQDAERSGGEVERPTPLTEDPSRRSICTRCLQVVDDGDKIQIGEQGFHDRCARCYFCHTVPKDHVKIYYGQVFCEDCFHRHVLNRSQDKHSAFLKDCFEQWHNPQFAEQMKEFMSSGAACPCLVLMQCAGGAGGCRCGRCPPPRPARAAPAPWQSGTEARKSAKPATPSEHESLGSVELTFEDRELTFDERELTYDGRELTDASADSGTESAKDCFNVAAAEKIENLTKYLREIDTENQLKKWKNFIAPDDRSWRFGPVEQARSMDSWVNLQDCSVKADCPKCLWQCGPIFVTGRYFCKECCGDNNAQ